jgi:nucleoside-diphosphate-sugar epimerase
VKVAVTGAGGFVGSAVVAELAKRGIEAVRLVRTARGEPGEAEIGDLAGASIDPAKLQGADVVIHLAAVTHSPNGPDDGIEKYRAVNVGGTVALVEAAIAAKASRFLFVSSIKAVAERSAPGHPIDSNTAPAPEDAYGITKLEAEQSVRERCSGAGVEWVIVRPPLVYGAEAKGNFGRLIRMVRSGLPLPLGAVNNRRSLLHVENLADALVAACTAPGAAGQIVTLCDSTLSTPELLRAVAQSLGVRARLLPFPPVLLRAIGRALGRGAEVERLCGSLELDPRASMAVLGWTPPFGLAEALSRTVGK